MDPEPGDASLDESYKQIIQGIEAQDICVVLRAAGDALWELRRPGHGPETYHHLYKQVTDMLEHVSKWYVQDDFKYRRNILHIYASSQQNGNVIPRLYLMVIAAYAILYRQYVVRGTVQPPRTNVEDTDALGSTDPLGSTEPNATTLDDSVALNRNDMAETVIEADPYCVLRDIMCMLNTSQDPLRSLYLRYFATAKMNDILHKVRHLKCKDHLKSWPLSAEPSGHGKSSDELRRQKTEKQQRAVNGIEDSAPPSEDSVLNEYNVFDFFMAMLIADVKLLTRIEYKYGRGIIGTEVRSKHTFIADEAFNALYDTVKSPNAPQHSWTHVFAPRLFKVISRFKNNTTLNYFYINIIQRSGPTRLIMTMDELLLSIFHSGIDSISDLGVLLNRILTCCGATNGNSPESEKPSQDSCPPPLIDDCSSTKIIEEVIANIHTKLVETVPDLITQFTTIEPHRVPKLLHLWVYLVRILSLYARYGLSVIHSVELLLNYMCNPLSQYSELPPQGLPPPPGLPPQELGHDGNEIFGKALPLESGNEHPDTASDLTEVSGADVARAWESLRCRVRNPVLAAGLADIIKLSIEHQGFVPEVEQFINSVMFYFKNDANTYALSILRGLIQKDDISSLCRSSSVTTGTMAETTPVAEASVREPPRITRILELIVSKLTEEAAESFELAKLAHKVGDCRVPSDDRFDIFAVLRGACEYLKTRGVKCPVDLAALCHECIRLVSDVWSKMVTEHDKLKEEQNELQEERDKGDAENDKLPAEDDKPPSEHGKPDMTASTLRVGLPDIVTPPIDTQHVADALTETDRPVGRDSVDLLALDFESGGQEEAGEQESSIQKESVENDLWNEEILERRVGHRYSLKMLIQFLHGCCTDLVDLHADLAFPHLLSAAVLTNKMKGEYANATYEFVSLAIQVYETSFVNTKYEVRSLQKLSYILYSYIDTIDPQHWNMIIVRLCTYSTKLLNDVDQAQMIIRCALLFNKPPYSSYNRCVECLAKSLRILQNTAPTSQRRHLAFVCLRQAAELCESQGNTDINDELRLQIQSLSTHTEHADVSSQKSRGISDLASQYTTRTMNLF